MEHSIPKKAWLSVIISIFFLPATHCSKYIQTIKAHEEQISCLSWCKKKNSSTFASGSFDTTIKIWNFQNNMQRIAHIKTIQDHKCPIRDIDWHPQLPIFISASDDKTFRLWLLENQNKNKAIRFFCSPKQQSGIRCASWHPTKPLFVTTAHDGNIHFWEFDTQTTKAILLEKIKPHTTWISSLKWHPRYSILASTALDGTIWTHEYSNAGLFSQKIYQGSTLELITAVAWNPQSPLFIASTGTKEFIKKKDTNFMSVKNIGITLFSNHKQLKKQSFIKTHLYWINAIAWHPILPLIACASGDEAIGIWFYDSTNKNLTPLTILNGHNDEVTSICWHPTKPLLVSGDNKGFLKLWHIAALDITIKTKAGNDLKSLCNELRQLKI
ncbi:MAG: WD40 repeat domain-containing protein [bacterium]